MTVYLDHAATTPLRTEVLEAYARALRSVGNPSSSHRAGQSARDLVETGREQVAAALDADPVEVLLTAGGTEAVNLGIKGLYWARRAADPARRRILVPRGEHAATTESVAWLARHEAAEVQWIPLDALGRLDLAAAAAALDAHPREVALVSTVWASNEVGTVQPIRELAALAARHGVPVHVDGIGAVGQVPVAFRTSGIAALSIAGHKLGAPVSTGALILGREWSVEPLLHGGDQQRGRSGTEDAAGAVALGLAAELAARELPETAPRVAALRDRLLRGIRERVPDATLRGDPDPGGRLPGNAHITVAGADGDGLLYLLDAAGFAVSTGAACRAGVTSPSPVLMAMGLDETTARGALRMTLGGTTTTAEVDALLEVLPAVVERARAAVAASRSLG
ncbi:MAG: cysteine desulfurase [Micrococcales bacterium]|nr:cysteine desulfurase [Micrococcales bacterium]